MTHIYNLAETRDIICAWIKVPYYDTIREMCEKVERADELRDFGFVFKTRFKKFHSTYIDREIHEGDFGVEITFYDIPEKFKSHEKTDTLQTIADMISEKTGYETIMQWHEQSTDVIDVVSRKNVE